MKRWGEVVKKTILPRPGYKYKLGSMKSVPILALKTRFGWLSFLKVETWIPFCNKFLGLLSPNHQHEAGYSKTLVFGAQMITAKEENSPQSINVYLIQVAGSSFGFRCQKG